MGYVQNVGGGNYHMTNKLLQLCRNSILNNHFLAVARIHMNKLSKILNVPVQVVVRDGQDVVYIDAVINTSTTTNTITRIGHRVPMYRTAAGRSILATLEDSEAENVLKNSNRVAATPYTIVEIDKLMEEIRNIRERGYAVNIQEDEVGIICVAVALSSNSSSGQPTETSYAISISWPNRKTKNENISKIALELMKTRDNILFETAF
jgi:DNA-binding IclR family transcriptional regulator